MFIEAKSPKYWGTICLLIFLTLTIPNSWLPELESSEAIYALIAKDIQESGDHFNTRLQGNPITIPPLTSWLLSAFFKVLPINEFTIRLLGILSLGVLAILCGFVSYRAAGPRGAAATVAATMSSYIALSQAVFDNKDMLFCLLINASWFVWYILGREQRHWLYAWFFAHLLVFLAVLTTGFKAVFFFYFPLLFLRRPLKIWLRLRQADHILSAVFLCLFVILWTVKAPYQMEKVIQFFQEFEHHEPSSNYIVYLLTFFVVSILSYMPWVFLVWPAFCVAFHPLERDPILGQFLRTITFSLFYFFWLFPEVKPEILFPLIGPLSVLVGLNYEILVRRYGQQLLYLPRSICWATLLGLGACGVVIAISGGGEFTLPRGSLVLCTIFLGCSVVMALTTLVARLNVQIWFIIAFSMIIFRLAFSSGYQGFCAYRELSVRRELGEYLSRELPTEAIVYEMTTKKEFFPTISYYLNRSVTKVSDVRFLPYHEDTVFVLSENKIPISRNRDWIPISKAVTHNDYVLRMWKGEKRAVEGSPNR